MISASKHIKQEIALGDETDPDQKISRRIAYFIRFFLLLMVSLSFSFASFADQEAPDQPTPQFIDSSELPATVIALANVYRWFGDADHLQPIPNREGPIPLKILAKNLEKLPSPGKFPLDIPTRMCFSQLAFVVQNGIEGHRSGFHFPHESILFVTTPIETFGNRVLMILSDVSPERTSVVAINNELSVELLFDSFEKGEIENAKSTTVGSIYGIEVQRAGYLTLHERPGRIGGYDNKRVFIIDVTEGRFKLTVQDDPVPIHGAGEKTDQ